MPSLLCLMVVIANVSVNGIYWASGDQGNYSKDFGVFGSEMERLVSAPERAVASYLGDTPAGRTDSSILGRNTSAVWRIPTMIYYSSLENKNVSNFFSKLENCGQSGAICLLHTDQRAILNTLASVRYHIEPDSKSCYVPYGYTEIGKTPEGNTLYENDYALPWGYTYDTAMSYEYLDSLNGVQREEAMLQAVALENETGLEKTRAIAFDGERIPYTVVCKDCVWEDDVLDVKRNNAVISLNFDIPAYRTAYLRFKNFDPSGSGKNKLTLTVADENIKKSVTSFADTNGQYYSGKVDHIVNLGYSRQGRQALTITIPEKGRYRLADIELYALPMDNYQVRVDALRAEPLKNIEWGTNRLTGTIDVSQDKILCMSIPYSNGWSAMVDGKKAEILRGNYMFMCIPLASGHHDIEFFYCSPGLKPGILVSLVSLCIVIGLLVTDRRKSRRKR